MNYSFWEKQWIESPTDITILGSGIVGLSTALSIKETNPDISVKVLERGYMPYGASTKNAGFSCFGSISELLDDIDSMGETKCMEVVKMRWKGLHKLKERVGATSLKYNPCGGTELFRKGDEEIKTKCIDSISYCNNLMRDYLDIEDCYSFKDRQTLNGFLDHAIYNRYEGSINPMYMMQDLIKKCVSDGVQIFNGIHIINIDKSGKQVQTDHGLNINYKKLIVCTNGFASQLLSDFDVKPARNQVLMTHVLPGLKLDSTYHVDKGYLYFRSYEGRILLGGGRNMDPNTETTSEFGTTENIQSYLKSFLEILYPGASHKIDTWWSGIMGVGDTKYPICEWINEDILAGVRLGGMGVAIGSYLGEKLAKKVTE